MPENIRFFSEKERREIEIAERLQKEGGILYREEIDPETNETKRYVIILGVEIETYATREDIEEIKKELVLTELDQKLLRIIAECYKLRQPLMIEGDPGVGKTFLLKKFVQLIHGKDAPILMLVGTPRTSELEILGHWAPRGLKENEAKAYEDFLKRFMESDIMRGLRDRFNQKLNELNQRFLKGEIDQKTFQEEFGDLTTQYINESRAKIIEIALLYGIAQPETEWEFKEGALLQAYNGREGKGYILIVDEFNLIPSNYQQIFLQIGGEKGALSDSISFWGNAGKTRYPRGKDTWICFTSNYPEKTPGRSEVVAPMTDRLVWITITSEEAKKKEEEIILSAGGRLSGVQTQLKPEIVQIPVIERLAWDKVLDGELGRQIAKFVYLLHSGFKDYCEKVGDYITIKGEKRRRTQQLKVSLRNAFRIYNYLDHFQVRDPKTGRIDIGRTLFNAFSLYYLNRLVDPDARKTMENLFYQLLQGETGKVNFEGRIMTRKEMFDILVERASITEEERKKQEEQKEENKRRELERAKFDAEDMIERALKNPNIIDDEVKERLRSLLKILRRPAQ